VKAIFLGTMKFVALVALGVSTGTAVADLTVPHDPHYSAVGFFDIHICNWPERPPFVMLLFSTTEFAKINQIDVTDPAGRTFHVFNRTRFRLIRQKGKPEKRVFINEIDLPEQMVDGWYHARITMQDGTVHTAADFVIVRKLAWTQIVAPPANAKDLRLPLTLRWRPVPGAQYYRVFVRDLWDDQKIVYESKPLTKTELRVPDGKLLPGGLYRWRVHARDVNEHELLGDFNHGSQNEPVEFAIAQ